MAAGGDTTDCFNNEGGSVATKFASERLHAPLLPAEARSGMVVGGRSACRAC